MGALVTLQLADDSPMRDLPWVVTFGPLRDDEEWDPVVCGPYERGHALGLAEAVVTDEPLMAVVEPLLTRVSAAEIWADIDEARQAAQTPPPVDEDPAAAGNADPDPYANSDPDADPDSEPTAAGGAWVLAGGRDPATDHGAGRRGDRADVDPAWATAGGDWTEPELDDARWSATRPGGAAPPAPTADEVRAGLARIAARLSGTG